MQQRQLGRTSHMSSAAIFGAVALATIDQPGANSALDLALEHGINHIDVAPGYVDAEERVGPWLQPRRDQFFLGCKTAERRRNPAMMELNRSLKRLRTDYLDLYQLHAITTLDELDAAFSPGGAMETLRTARDQGKVRFLGITSHGMQAASVQMNALERFDFDTIMFPLTPRLYAEPDYRRDAEHLLQIAAERGVGVMIIKAAAKGPRPATGHRFNTWYEPHDAYEAIEQGVRFALSQPVTGVVTTGDVEVLPLFLRAVENFSPLSPDEQDALIAQRAEQEELIFHGAEFNMPD